MIDPVTALATASAAYNVVKKGFEMGREIEDMASDIGRWMSAVSDISKAEQDRRNPPLFKKLVYSQSAEQEALEAWQAKQKADKMRDELRELISFMKGPSAWAELVTLENKIRKERQEAANNQIKKRRKFVEGILIASLIAIGTSFIIWFIWFVVTYNNA
jgi:hypothetical protein